MIYTLTNRKIGDLTTRVFDPDSNVEIVGSIDTTNMTYEKQLHFARLALDGDLEIAPETAPEIQEEVTTKRSNKESK